MALHTRAVFLGAPGAGKGTQAMRLARETGVVHISTGDMLRGHVARGTPLGTEARDYMDKGQLVPDRLIIAMVEDRIGEPDAASAWILDGFPRTLPQAEALDTSLTGSAQSLTHVVYFHVPEEVLTGRLTGRRVCGKCGAIWHVQNHPTSKAGVCDTCGGALTQRSDDRPEAVGKRLAVYASQTKPLLDYYRQRNLLTEIDANRSPETVYETLIGLMQ